MMICSMNSFLFLLIRDFAALMVHCFPLYVTLDGFNLVCHLLFQSSSILSSSKYIIPSPFSVQSHSDFRCFGEIKSMKVSSPRNTEQRLVPTLLKFFN